MNIKKNPTTNEKEIYCTLKQRITLKARCIGSHGSRQSGGVVCICWQRSSRRFPRWYFTLFPHTPRNGGWRHSWEDILQVCHLTTVRRQWSTCICLWAATWHLWQSFRTHQVPSVNFSWPLSTKKLYMSCRRENVHFDWLVMYTIGGDEENRTRWLESSWGAWCARSFGPGPISAVSVSIWAGYRTHSERSGRQMTACSVTANWWTIKPLRDG